VVVLRVLRVLGMQGVVRRMRMRLVAAPMMMAMVMMPVRRMLMTVAMMAFAVMHVLRGSGVGGRDSARAARGRAAGAGAGGRICRHEKASFREMATWGGHAR